MSLGHVWLVCLYISRAPVRVRIIIYKPEDKVNIQNDERLQSRGVLLVVQRYEIEQILKIKKKSCKQILIEIVSVVFS